MVPLPSETSIFTKSAGLFSGTQRVSGSRIIGIAHKVGKGVELIGQNSLFHSALSHKSGIRYFQGFKNIVMPCGILCHIEPYYDFILFKIAVHVHSRFQKKKKIFGTNQIS